MYRYGNYQITHRPVPAYIGDTLPLALLQTGLDPKPLGKETRFQSLAIFWMGAAKFSAQILATLVRQR
jgi:hypothetical protein